MFVVGQHIQVCCFLLRSNIRYGVTNGLQDSFACDQWFFIHIESFSFPFEHFSLHLTLKIGPQSCFFLSILFDTPLIVFVVSHLANCGEAIRADFCDPCGCFHVRCSDLFRHKPGTLLGGGAPTHWWSYLAAKSGHSECLRCIRVRESTISILDLVFEVFLKFVHLECDLVQLICLLPHDISSVLHVLFSLPIPQLFKRIKLIGKGISSARLFDFKFGLSHLVGLLMKNEY